MSKILSFEDHKAARQLEQEAAYYRELSARVPLPLDLTREQLLASLRDNREKGHILPPDSLLKSCSDNQLAFFLKCCQMADIEASKA